MLQPGPVRSGYDRGQHRDERGVHARGPRLSVNFGRVELYAGTPLPVADAGRKRCWGDYMQWDYALGSPEVERIFALSMRCFHERNFGDNALANILMGDPLRRRSGASLSPDQFEPQWLADGQRLNRLLALDTADALTEISNT